MHSPSPEAPNPAVATTMTGKHDDVLAALEAWARANEAIRCVLLVGSRADPVREVDAFSDYDLVLYVTDVEAFTRPDDWVEWRGPVFLRYRERRASDDGGTIAADLVLYEDGVKVDHTVVSVARLRRMARTGLPEMLDAGYRVLIDKDNLAGTLPPATGRAYLPVPPTDREYLALVEEFWWESFYVARNLRRRELLPARYSLDFVMKLQLLRPLLEWKVGVETGWTEPVGAWGRGLTSRLDPALRGAMEATYGGGSVAETWEALFATARLFERVAVLVADALGFEYPRGLAESATEILMRLCADDDGGERSF